MAPKSPKSLTPADVDIWKRVTKTVKAYDPARPMPRPSAPAKNARPVFSPKSSIYQPAPKKFHAPKHPPQVTADKRTRRGKISIDRRIDLHDMTQDVARDALLGAIISARSKHQRCVLVITGKGGLSYKGVLRRMFPIWLAAPDIRPHIASYAQAHQRHGGNGAWYVFLKRAG